MLDKLYVNFTGLEGPVKEYEPVIHKAYPKVLNREGIHTAIGDMEIKLEDLSKEEDWDCAYLNEFVNEASKQLVDVRGREIKVRSTRASKRLLVLLAGIGEGKTTLLDYFFRIWSNKSGALGNVERINIDFEGKTYLEPEEVHPNYLADLVIEEIHKEHIGLFKDQAKVYEVLKEPLEAQEGLLDIIEENQGLDARKHEEMELIKRFCSNSKIRAASLVNYLVNSEKKKVVITHDNVDRVRNSESQYKLLTLIHEALHQWDCCAIVCLREYTYGNLWPMGDWGFQRPMIYHKRPPRFASVLKKRFTKFPFEKYAKKASFYVGGKKYEIVNVKRFVSNIAKYLWAEDMESSLFFLNNGDIRQMLDMVRTFLSYHYLDLQALFTATFLKSRDEIKQIQSLNINFDNFICSITSGNYQYYCLSELFAGPREVTFTLNIIGGPQNMPLLPYRILTYLRRFNLVNIKPLIKKAICIGVTEEQVRDILGLFLSHYLIESMQGGRIENVQEVIITRKGVYYFDVLSTLATYIENVMNDTWWDERIDPYAQDSTLLQECGFLYECLDYILRLELTEAQRINRDCWASYKEFLSKEPYSARLAENFFSYLWSRRSRGTRVRKEFFDKFRTKITEIDSAIEGEDLPCDRSSRV